MSLLEKNRLEGVAGHTKGADVKVDLNVVGWVPVVKELPERW